MDEPRQAELPLQDKPLFCRRCGGIGEVYRIDVPGRVEVVGGVHKTCPECGGKGMIG
jgi:DnaJ-class molecular chaperone